LGSEDGNIDKSQARIAMGYFNSVDDLDGGCRLTASRHTPPLMRPFNNTTNSFSFFPQLTMTSYHPALIWPRSDGDISTFPSKAEQIPSSTTNWWELLDLSAEKYKLYEEKVGKHVADKLGVRGAYLPPRSLYYELIPTSGHLSDAFTRQLRYIRSSQTTTGRERAHRLLPFC
jgi:hypothetical protein